VLVTCAEDRKGLRRTLYCFNRADGKQLWAKTVTLDRPEPTHATNPYASSSPATDGQRVIVWHGSAGLFCYDLDGKEMWKVGTGPVTHIWGYAASPVINGDAVYLNCGPGVRSFVIALNKNDGKELWRTEEPDGADDKSPITKNWIGSWSTGVIAKVDGAEQLVVFQPRGPKAYDLTTGNVLWTCPGAGDLAYSDVLMGDGIGVALAGFGGAAIGFKPGGAGDTSATHRLWRSAGRHPQRIGSGVLIGRHVFMPHEPGTITCFDATTGKDVWSHRIPGQSFWSSIVQAGDRLYLTSQQGTTFVFAPDPAKWILLASNELDEKVNATPAVSNGQLFLRTFNHLYCIGN
jgi:outer membrane protein assembly factor BamB